MFPVAELSDLNNTDFSFLDELCFPEDYQDTSNIKISNMNPVEGSLTELPHALSSDWLSGNVGLDTLVAGLSFPQPSDFNLISYPSASNNSRVNAPEIVAESPSMIYDPHLLTDISLFAESQSPEERLNSCCDESEVEQNDMNHAISPTSESDEVIIEHGKEGECLDGKKYRQMRLKNNIASQRSRKLRKQKNQDMVETLKKLEKDNKELTKLAAELEKQKDALQKQLMQIISKK